MEDVNAEAELASSPSRGSVGSKSGEKVLLINPKHPDNVKKCRATLRESLQSAFKAYRRAFKENADNYIEENNVGIAWIQFQCRCIRDCLV